MRFTARSRSAAARRRKRTLLGEQLLVVPKLGSDSLKNRCRQVNLSLHAEPEGSGVEKGCKAGKRSERGELGARWHYVIAEPITPTHYTARPGSRSYVTSRSRLWCNTHNIFGDGTITVERGRCTTRNPEANCIKKPDSGPLARGHRWSRAAAAFLVAGVTLPGVGSYSSVTGRTG